MAERTYTVAVTDEDGTVLDSFETELEEGKYDTPLTMARNAVVDVAQSIRLGIV